MTTDQEKKLDEIYTAIVGNPNTGVTGLAQRVSKLEDYKETDEKLKAKVAGGLAIGTPILVGLYHWLLDHLLGLKH